jgi:hypothetical protein
MQCKREFLPWVFKLAELIFLKLTIYLKQAIASLIKIPFLSAVLPWYLHMKIAPHFLPRAQAPSTLKGCVGILDDGYIRCTRPVGQPQVDMRG